MEGQYINIKASVVFKIALVVLVIFALYELRDIALVVIASVVIASAVEPGVVFMARFKIARLPSVLIIYLAIAVIIAVLFYFVLPPFLGQTATYLENLPKYADQIDLWNPINGKIIEDNATLQNFSDNFSFKEIADQISNIFSTSGGILKTLTKIFGGAFGFILIVVLSFYLAVQEKGVESFLKVVSPANKQKYIVGLWQRSQHKIGRWMQGQLLLGVIIGILVYLGLTILGIKHALVLAVIAGVFELIPVFGPILSAIPAVVAGYVDGGTTKALLVVGLYTILQQFENHLIYPLVVRKIVGVPPMLVILALIIGGKLAGFLGILLSVPIAAIFMEYYDDLRKRRADEEVKESAV